MKKSRIEAFSDGVIAIIITLLVLNLTPPAGDSFSGLFSITHNILLYVYSFALIAIYWSNHHHLFQLIEKINWKILWTNNLFLFSVTLFPFGVSWLSDHFNSLAPQLLYGTFILLADSSFFILIVQLNKYTNENNLRIVHYSKSLISIGLNIIALVLGYLFSPACVFIFNTLMILLWIFPSKEIEQKFE